MNTAMKSAALLPLLCSSALAQTPLGLPVVPIPADNPQTPGKIALGDKLFHDLRLSTTGTVGCVTCHDPAKAFTDSPLKVSVGVEGKTGTRNAPTVINSAYMTSLFWDGREPSLETQSHQPFINPVEGGLEDHQPLLATLRGDPDYVRAFRQVFGLEPGDISMREVGQAIASFERTIIAGDSPFDLYYFGGQSDALTLQQQRGLEVFLNQGRCVSCHVIEQDQALFTDSRFHNIGVGINRIQDEVPRLAAVFLTSRKSGADVDKTVLTDAMASELGRFAVDEDLSSVGGFKTPTLRNVARTAPYMHDGSLTTLRDVVIHYNLGGRSDESTEVNPYLSGGIRPLGLDDQQIDDLVAFLNALTSPQFTEDQPTAASPASTEGGEPHESATVTPEVSATGERAHSGRSAAHEPG